MPLFNLIKSLKSWFAVDRFWSHLRPLIKALRTPPCDWAALAALKNELTRNLTIHHARSLHADGLSLRKVSAALQQRGFQARTGAVFHPGQIQRMVASGPGTPPRRP